MFVLRCSVFSVRCSVFGVRCPVFGVRCSVFSVRVLGRSALDVAGIREKGFGFWDEGLRRVNIERAKEATVSDFGFCAPR